MLTLPKCCENYIVYCDTYRVGLGWVLMQASKMIAYASIHIKVHVKNYDTHYLELAAVVFALMLWRHYLYGVHVDVFKDHKSLQYVLTQRELTLHQRRWFELLKDYDMNVHYPPCKANIVVDALSKMSMGSTTHVSMRRSSWPKRYTYLPNWICDWLTLLVGGVLVHPNS